MTKALMFQTYQPVAHFRNPQLSQDDFITSLDLPSPTTIVGMLSYICDCRFNEELQISVIGTHELRENHFSRGENADFWSKYQKFVKNHDESIKNSGKRYLHYKTKLADNRVMNYEVLRDVSLTIFVKGSEKLLFFIEEKLKSPKRYLSLGRKEDFVILGIKENGQLHRVEPKIIDLEEKIVQKIPDAIEMKMKIQHTYLPIVNEENQLDEKVLASGTIYSLPYTYEDIEGQKAQRRMKYKKYVLIKDGVYLLNTKVNKYTDRQGITYVFSWM